MGFADHVNFQTVTHAGLFQILTEYAVNQTNGREVLNTAETLILQLLQVNVHNAERVGTAYAGENRSFLYHRQNLSTHLNHNLVGIAVGQQACQRSAAGHSVASGVVNNQDVCTAGFTALCGDSGSGANAYQDFAACNLFLKLCDIFFSCKSIHCVPLSS